MWKVIAVNVRKVISVVCLSLLIPLAAHGANNVLSGTVKSGETPMPSMSVSLYRAGTQRPGTGAALLGRAQTNASGAFQISYKAPADGGAILYVIADGQRSGSVGSPIRFASVPNPASIPDNIAINERTTVAGAYAMAQFTRGSQIGGKSPGLRNAAGTAQNLADGMSGALGYVLATSPNGDQTSTVAVFNSLANALAACVQSPANTGALLVAANPPRGPAPRDTFQALVNIAQNPWKSVSAIFAITQQSSVYQPALMSTAQPDAWTIAIRYQGDGPDGQEMDGPGNVAFDAEGNAWISNNYNYGSNPDIPVCGSDKVIKLTPTGGTPLGAPYQGGGLYGAGFGITLDPSGNVWVANFGFQGVGCPVDYVPLAKSLSQFNPDGVPLSPIDGFKSDLFSQPQGTVSDKQGNIWAANCGGQSVTIIPHGDPTQLRNVEGVGSKPFDLAIDTRSHVWVTVNNAPTGNELFPSGHIVEMAPDGTIVGNPVDGNDGIRRPMGIASDSMGNIWVSDSGILDLPCEGDLSTITFLEDIGTDGENNAKAGVTLIRPMGNNSRKVTTFSKGAGKYGGLALPWGIAVDGNDNVFVCNFAGQRLTELCGVRLENCPPGKKTGDPISPDNGYSSDALTRNTGVQIDSSGNVWVMNNWLNSALEHQTNPGGHEVVVFVGLAAPIRMPLIGPPQQP